MKQRFLILMLVMFISCGEDLMEKPKDLIPRQDMIEILKELTIINSARNTNVSALRENEIDPTAMVFKKYGIDSVQFVTSDRYYASLPAIYEGMYKEIEAQLDSQKQILVEEKRIKDSMDLAGKANGSPFKKRPQ